MAMGTFAAQQHMRALVLLPVLVIACTNAPATTEPPSSTADTRAVNDSLVADGEKHFKSLKKLTFGGDNAEAYWSFAGDRLIFQATNPAWGESCDQIYVFDPFTDDLNAQAPKKISINGGRTTCSYFLPGDSLVLFGSTHEGDAACPA